MRYFDNSPFKTNKIKDLFINSDTRNINNSDEYLSVVRDVGVIKYSERSDSGNKTSDSPEKYKMVDVGDLVINPMNVTIGSVGVSEYSGCLSGVYLVLKPKTSVNSKYYHYLFHDKGFQKYLKTISYGIMEIRESINKTEFFQFKIPKPSVDEQKEIVSYLDKKTNQINELIRKIEQKIELLKEQRTSLINEVVTKGLNPDVDMKDSGVEWIGEIPSHWEITKVKFISNLVIDGSHHTPTYTDSGVPFLRVTDLHNERVDLDKVKFISEEEHQNLVKRTRPERGDVLLSKNGTIGLTKVIDWDWEFSIFVSLCLIKFKETFLPELFSYFFQSSIVDSQIKESSKQSTVTNLHLDKIRELLLINPPVSEQLQMIEYLDEQTKEIDKTILIEEKRIKLLNEYKQSLISEVVTGKKRVV